MQKVNSTTRQLYSDDRYSHQQIWQPACDSTCRRVDFTFGELTMWRVGTYVIWPDTLTSYTAIKPMCLLCLGLCKLTLLDGIQEKKLALYKSQYIRYAWSTWTNVHSPWKRLVNILQYKIFVTTRNYRYFASSWWLQLHLLHFTIQQLIHFGKHWGKKKQQK